MNKKLIRIFIIMTILVLILGTLLHFTYEWSNRNSFIGIFSATSESTWEHLKLTFFPMSIIGLISYFYIKDISNNFIEGLTVGILVSMLFIIVFFYGYQLILGSDYFILDILDFVLGVCLGEFIFYTIVSMENSSSFYTRLICFTIWAILFVLFIVFTFYTPNYGIFA